MLLLQIYRRVSLVELKIMPQSDKAKIAALEECAQEHSEPPLRPEVLVPTVNSTSDDIGLCCFRRPAELLQNLQHLRLQLRAATPGLLDVLQTSPSKPAQAFKPNQQSASRNCSQARLPCRETTGIRCSRSLTAGSGTALESHRRRVALQTGHSRKRRTTVEPAAVISVLTP